VPAEVNVRALLEKYVGKEAGDSIAANIEPMIGAKKSAAEIEEVFKAGISAYYEKQANAAYTEIQCFPFNDRRRVHRYRQQRGTGEQARPRGAIGRSPEPIDQHQLGGQTIRLGPDDEAIVRETLRPNTTSFSSVASVLVLPLAASMSGWCVCPA